MWVLDYLTSRPQYVKLGPSVTSRTICTNTGAPQGTVLSPFLFSLYTADCKNVHEPCPITKFADDTGLTGQITDDDDSCYRQEIDRFVNTCDQNYLQLNVGKTREMVIDFRRKVPVYSDVAIKGETVEKVETYRYLEIVIDNKLSWKQNLKYISRKLIAAYVV